MTGGDPAPSPGVLVVAASLRSDPSELGDAATVALASDLAGLLPGTSVEVVVLDGHRSAPAVRRLRAAGVEVRDLSAAAALTPASVPTVVVAGSARRHAATVRLLRDQPQAARVLFLGDPRGPSFRALERLAALTPPGERAGLATVVQAAERRLSEEAGRCDAVWCEEVADARWLSGRIPTADVAHIPAALPARPATVPGPAGRAGLVLLADRCFDAAAADEAAVLRFLDGPALELRRTRPGLPVRIVVDEPTPRLRAAMTAAGVERVPAARVAAAVAGARVAWDDRPGGGSAATRRWAAATSTPTAGAPVCGSARSAVVEAGRLLDDDATWRETRARLDAQVAVHHGTAQRSGALGAALARLGHRAEGAVSAPVAMSPLPPLWRQAPTAMGPLRPSRHHHVTDRDERYRLWAQRETGRRAAALAAGSDDDPGRARPLVGVVVLGAGGHRAALRASLRSLCAQVSSHWRLLVACAPGSEAEITTLVADAGCEGGAGAGHAVVWAGGEPGPLGAARLALGLPDVELVTVLVAGDVLRPYALTTVDRWMRAEPGAEAVYADEDRCDAEDRLVEAPAKPDWSPTTLLSDGYTGRMLVVRRGLLTRLLAATDGGDVPGPAAGVDAGFHDLALRLDEHTDRVGHISEPLLTRAFDPAAADRALRVDRAPGVDGADGDVVMAALCRRGRAGAVTAGPGGGLRVRPAIPGQPGVAVIVPTRDRPELLRRSLLSVLGVSTYPGLEVVVVDNGTVEREALELLADMPAQVLRYPHPFNYARMMNFAVEQVTADVVVSLNNDTEVWTPDWLESMLELAVQPEIGAVGARLHLPDGSPQHEGVLVGAGDSARNLVHGGLWGRGAAVRDVSAVTGACMMMRRSVYEQVGGNDERLRIAYNDVDLCLRVRQAGYRVVYTPYATLLHDEGSSRGRFEHPDEWSLFEERWLARDVVDPHYAARFAPGPAVFQLDV